MTGTPAYPKAIQAPTAKTPDKIGKIQTQLMHTFLTKL